MITNSIRWGLGALLLGSVACGSRIQILGDAAAGAGGKPSEQDNGGQSVGGGTSNASGGKGVSGGRSTSGGYAQTGSGGYAQTGSGGDTETSQGGTAAPSPTTGGTQATAGGAPSTGGGPTASCATHSLDVTWPIIVGCLAPPDPGTHDITRLRCAFPHQVNNPDYGPFVACCPLQRPFGCPNGTPQSCHATAAEAAASCGADECQLCAPHDEGAGGAGAGSGGATD